LLKLLVLAILFVALQAFLASAITAAFSIAGGLTWGQLCRTGTVVLWVVARDLAIGITILMGVETVNAVMSILVAIVALEEHPAMEGVVRDSLTPFAKPVLTFRLLTCMCHLPPELPITDPQSVISFPIEDSLHPLVYITLR